MAQGYLVFLLHAHLPFVRHPEYDEFLEENWLFEAISETYLPILRVIDRLDQERVPFKLAISISPTLAAMLADELLGERYVRHLSKLLELADRELERTRGDEQLYPLAVMYKELFSQNLEDFTEKYSQNILKGFDYYYKRGRIELLTTPATHPYLPLYEQYHENTRAQMQVAVDSHSSMFGKSPKGMWLPECGYSPGVEEHLKNVGIDYFLLAEHGVLFGENKPKAGVYAPIECPNGVKAFARDHASASMVWSADEGYPSDFVYRDFYRDIGHDLPLDYISPYIHEGTVRIHTGFKYHAITGKTENKRPYRPAPARRKAVEHAENFIYNQLKQLDRLEPLMDRPPVITCLYDAELFGHWWFEGPIWIENVIRLVAQTDGRLEMTSPARYLKQYQDFQVTRPAFSSWGSKGYSEVWLDGKNDWIYRHTHKIIERMCELVDRFPDESGLKERALNQAAREVLLSQASDWPFIMRAGTTVPYAVERVREHVHNFNTIYDALSRGNVGTEWLTTVERKNKLFPDIDYRVFRRLSKRDELAVTQYRF
jgi:1,4-alpha-glucan branching enzyme